MARTIKTNTRQPLIGYVFGFFFFCIQTKATAERWQIVVLPDTNYNTPIELPALADLHGTISQGLTVALTNADFEVLKLHYIGLPNCSLEDCSMLTDQDIRRAAKHSGKEVNLALLYQLNAFKQRQAASQKWYFSLSGRLLDLQSGAQQDAFAVDNWVNNPAKNCITDCLSMWLNQNLALLAQDLGMVLSEKLNALPRRFHYQLNFNSFSGAELQQIDGYLKSIEGYVADLLLADSQTENLAISQYDTQNTSRTYQYISELTASQLSIMLEKLNQKNTLTFELEYNNALRQFNLMRIEKTDSWEALSQFIADLLPSSLKQVSPTQVPKTVSAIEVNQQPPAADEADDADIKVDKEIFKDQQMWQHVISIDTLDSYQQYLTIWPQGQHFIQANAAIKVFQDDEISWQQASSKKTHHAFQQYLTLNPTGKYRYQAKRQLALLREQQQREQTQQENKVLAGDYYYRKNYPEALYYYRQAAKLGDISSQYLLGKMYESAKGTRQDMRQAAIWYAQAAEQGHSKAQATLGFMYSKGNGVNQNYSQAANWYQKAAEQGHMNAQYNLAYLYTLGQGVVKNYQQAAYWYQKSADQGDADAQNSLGKLYERGLGVNINLAKAKDFYQQAAAQGSQIARLNLQMLRN